MALKLCRGCGETKDRAEFYRATREKDGLQSRCKDCCKTHIARWRLANVDKDRANKVRWYEKVKDTDKYKARKIERGALWYAANKTQVCAASSQWYASNKERAMANTARWVRTHKDKRAEICARYGASHRAALSAAWAEYYARKKNASSPWANRAYVDLFYRIAKEETKRTGRIVHVDHIVPLQSKIVSGLHNEFNLQLLFANENLSKSNRRWPDMP